MRPEDQRLKPFWARAGAAEAARRERMATFMFEVVRGEREVSDGGD